MNFPIKFRQHSVLEVNGEIFEKVEGFVSDGDTTLRYGPLHSQRFLGLCDSEVPSRPCNSFGSIPSFSTRGCPTGYTKIGILRGVSNYPLFGRQRYPGSAEWEYYTEDNTRHMNKLHIPKSSFPTQLELKTGDTVSVLGLGECKVELYPCEGFRYNPLC